MHLASVNPDLGLRHFLAGYGYLEVSIRKDTPKRLLVWLLLGSALVLLVLVALYLYRMSIVLYFRNWTGSRKLIKL
jgi:hypothetical protein